MPTWLAELSGKTILYIVLGLVATGGVAGLVYKFKSDAKEIVQDKVQLAVKDITIGGQDDTIKVDEKLKKVDNDVGLQTLTAIKVADTKQKAAIAKTNSDATAIEQKFDTLPATPENQADEQQQLSTARINGLWDQYCKGVPSATECSAPVPASPPIEGAQNA